MKLDRNTDQTNMSVEETMRFAGHCQMAEDWIKVLVGWQQELGGCRHDINAPN
jgi:hypothetical protein